MFVIFEGLDKTAKSSMRAEFNNWTQFSHISFDRGPIGYLFLDLALRRRTIDNPVSQNFIAEAHNLTYNSDDFIIVYCYCSPDVRKHRLDAFHEKDIDTSMTYEEQQGLYLELLGHYNPIKVIMLDTSNFNAAKDELFMKFSAMEHTIS